MFVAVLCVCKPVVPLYPYHVDAANNLDLGEMRSFTTTPKGGKELNRRRPKGGGKRLNILARHMALVLYFAATPVPVPYLLLLPTSNLPCGN
eukprot:scaffold203680_cov43-Tisochrysis_lutea.AAC.1